MSGPMSGDPTPPPSTGTAVPRIVIVGAGFGGLTAAKALAHAPADVTVIDRSNHHLFQPLLYQVATAGLTPAQIASPVRSVLGGQMNTRVMLAEVQGVDVDRREVVLEDRRVGYDWLVLATGAAHAYFGHDEWAPFAPGLKTLDDAIEIRRRVLVAFEKAELEEDPAEQARLLTFVVVGGGPTGVELAGAIAELARRALSRDFHVIRRSMARVVLVEAGERLLPGFAPGLSAYARRALEALGVEVRLGRAVTQADAAGVRLGEEAIASAVVIWAAGVMASPAGVWLCAPQDRVGRVEVAPDLTVPGHPEIFVIGDAATLAGAEGRPLPGLAPVAKQQGAFVARLILGRLKGRRRKAQFRYRDWGSLATIGRRAAVIQQGAFRLTGGPAWVLWCAAHIYFLIGFRNRLLVTLDWLWAYVTFERGSRLITGLNGTRPKR
jgi:NADH dehydrogenase